MNLNEDKIAVRIALDILSQESGEDYDEFFQKKLDQHGVSNPGELDDEGKKKFFNEIEKEWTGEKDASSRKARSRRGALKKGDKVYHIEDPDETGTIVSIDGGSTGDAKVRWDDGEEISHQVRDLKKAKGRR